MHKGSFKNKILYLEEINHLETDSAGVRLRTDGAHGVAHPPPCSAPAAVPASNLGLGLGFVHILYRWPSCCSCRRLVGLRIAHPGTVGFDVSLLVLLLMVLSLLGLYFAIFVGRHRMLATLFVLELFFSLWELRRRLVEIVMLVAEQAPFSVTLAAEVFYWCGR